MISEAQDDYRGCAKYILGVIPVVEMVACLQLKTFPGQYTNRPSDSEVDERCRAVLEKWKKLEG